MASIINRDVTFREDLEVQDLDSTKKGEFVLNIVPNENEHSYCIQLDANWQFDSNFCGIVSQTTVNSDLNILKCEEMYFTQKGGVLTSQTLKIAQIPGEDEYEVLIIGTEGDTKNIKTRKLNSEAIANLANTGTLYLYQRLAIIVPSIRDNYKNFQEIDLDFNLVPVKYEFSQKDSTDMVFIKRENAKNHSLWNFEYSLNGKLNSAIDEDSQLRFTCEKWQLSKNFGRIQWEEDIEMVSKYLDEKNYLESRHMEYIQTHPRLKALLSDFMMHILIQKPEDVFAATAEYFKAFTDSSS